MPAPSTKVMRIVFVMALAVTNVGCRTMFIDKVATLSLEIRVVTQEGMPLDEVVVDFVDTGLDEARSRDRNVLRIGNTEDGQLRTLFKYAYGCTVRTRRARPPRCPSRGTFVIRFTKDGFETVDREFTLDSLPLQEHKRQLVVDVLMDPKVTSSGGIGRDGAGIRCYKIPCNGSKTGKCKLDHGVEIVREYFNKWGVKPCSTFTAEIVAGGDCGGD